MLTPFQSPSNQLNDAHSKTTVVVERSGFSNFLGLGLGVKVEVN